MNSIIRVEDLNFPLMRLKDLPVSEFAKQKLLTGEPFIEMPNNKCNAFGICHNIYTLKAPTFNIDRKFVRRGNIYLDSTCFRLASNKSGVLYHVNVTSYFLIIKDYTIICIFCIDCYSYDIVFEETSTRYEILFVNTGDIIIIKKKDLSYEVRWC